MKSIIESLKQMKTANSIAIITHLNADADALCSAISLKALLKKRYSHNKKLVVDIFTDTSQFSEQLSIILNNVYINKKPKNKYDLAIALDCPTLSRLGSYQNIFNKSKDTLLIDHHITCEFFARNNILKQASSTCEIIYNEYIKKRKFKASDEVYRLIYCGVITDTNEFNANMFDSTHKALADLVEKDKVLNLNLNKIREHFFNNHSKEKMDLLQRALKSLSFYENDKIACMTLFKQDLIETNTKQEDTLGIVDYAVKLKGVEIGIIFIKQEDNSYYVSLRSKEELDVSVIAQELGGGGHKNVAAFQSNLPLTTIKQQIFSKCKELLKGYCSLFSVEDLFNEEI